jgi:hypothetical protein
LLRYVPAILSSEELTFEIEYINGEKFVVMRRRLWKKEEGDKGESVGNKEDYD